MIPALVIGVAILLTLAVLVRIVWPMIDSPYQQIIRDEAEYNPWEP